MNCIKKITWERDQVLVIVLDVDRDKWSRRTWRVVAVDAFTNAITLARTFESIPMAAAFYRALAPRAAS